MAKIESPAFEYLAAELGASTSSQLTGLTLPELTRAIFRNAFFAHQEMEMLRILREESEDLKAQLRYTSRITEEEETIKRAARLLLAMRAGYIPQEISNDHFVGSMPEKIGVRNFVGESVRAVATEGLIFALQSPLQQEAWEEFVKARETKLFDNFVLSSPVRYTFEQGAIPAPGTTVYGIVHTHGDLRIIHGLSLKGAEISGGVPLEIFQIGPRGEVIPAVKKAA